jgi:hypothetical protein
MPVIHYVEWRTLYIILHYLQFKYPLWYFNHLKSFIQGEIKLVFRLYLE